MYSRPEKCISQTFYNTQASFILINAYNCNLQKPWGEVWPRVANPRSKWMIIITLSTEWLLIRAMLWGQAVPWNENSQLLEIKSPENQAQEEWGAQSWTSLPMGEVLRAGLSWWSSHCRNRAIPAHLQPSQPWVPEDRGISIPYWTTPCANYLAHTLAKISSELLPVPLLCDKRLLRVVMKDLGETKEHFVNENPKTTFIKA